MRPRGRGSVQLGPVGHLPQASVEPDSGGIRLLVEDGPILTIPPPAFSGACRGPGSDQILKMLDYFRDMTSGPGVLRFIVQPVAAILLGVLDGLRDAKRGGPPYLHWLWSDRGHRGEHLVQILKRLALPLLAGVLLSIVFQILIRKTVWLVTAVAFGLVFIALPYILSRSLVSSLRGRALRRRSAVP